MAMRRARRLLPHVARIAFVYAMLVLFAFPIFWTLMTALKTRVDAFASPPVWFFVPTLDNFRQMLFSGDFLRLLGNSLRTATANTLLAVVIGTAAAYGIVRYNAAGKNFMLWVLSIRMLPPIVAAVPLFTIFARLRLVDTPVVLPLIYLSFNLPLVIWMMHSFLRELPPELEESARIDGASTFEVLRRIVMPLVSPGLVATAVLCFIFAWNELLLGSIFTRLQARTISVALAGFIAAESEIDWGNLAAAGIIAMAPPVLLALLFQRYIVRGLTMGAVK
jgi:ABC-type glycerol-3-phosphate transport system permease component